MTDVHQSNFINFPQTIPLKLSSTFPLLSVSKIGPVFDGWTLRFDPLEVNIVVVSLLKTSLAIVNELLIT